jgi:addiction module HigA family antidote
MRRLHVPTNGPPVTAGEVLVEEFLKPLHITQSDFAKRIGVTFHRLNEIVNGKRGISTDTALRLAKALGTTPDLWLNLQRVVDLHEVAHSAAAREIEKIKPITYSEVA